MAKGDAISKYQINMKANFPNRYVSNMSTSSMGSAQSSNNNKELKRINSKIDILKQELDNLYASTVFSQNLGQSLQNIQAKQTRMESLLKQKGHLMYGDNFEKNPEYKSMLKQYEKYIGYT